MSQPARVLSATWRRHGFRSLKQLEKRIAELYLRWQKSPAEIARIYNVQPKTITILLQKAGVEKRPPAKRQREMRTQTIPTADPLDDENFRERIRQIDNESDPIIRRALTTELANEHKYSYFWVRKKVNEYRKRYGVPTLGQTEEDKLYYTWVELWHSYTFDGGTWTKRETYRKMMEIKPLIAHRLLSEQGAPTRKGQPEEPAPSTQPDRQMQAETIKKKMKRLKDDGDVMTSKGYTMSELQEQLANVGYQRPQERAKGRRMNAEG
jgi:hypothetical protein